MLADKFDAYGEELPDVALSKREGDASAKLSRVGQYAFWLLVVVIVSVRILIYPAAPTFDVGSATAPAHTVSR